MNNAAIHELNEYLSNLNDINDFDLEWRWDGHDTTPFVQVYEAADNHALAYGTIDSIVNQVRENLTQWGLKDVDTAPSTH